MAGAQLASKDFIERVIDALKAISQGSSASPVGELASILSVGKRFAVIGMGGEGNQSFDLGVGDHIEFGAGGGGIEVENTEGSGVTIAPGTGQKAGQITLPKGGIWKVQGYLSFAGGMADSQICCAFFDLTSGGTPAEAPGMGLMQKTYTNVVNQGVNVVPASAYIDCRTAAVTIELRILSASGATTVFAGSTNEGPTYMTAEQL